MKMEHFSHLSVFLNFPQQCFVVFSIKFFASLVKFIPKCMILFNVIVNETVFLTSFLDCSLLEYKGPTDFCVDFVPCYPDEFVHWL